MITALILILLAASFIGFWQQRRAYKPVEQSIVVSAYCIFAVAVIFGGIVP